MPDIVIRPNQIKQYTGYCRSTIYRLIAEGRWPKPHKLGKGRTSAVYWWLSEIKDALRKLEHGQPSREPEAEPREKSNVAA